MELSKTYYSFDNLCFKAHFIVVAKFVHLLIPVVLGCNTSHVLRKNLGKDRNPSAKNPTLKLDGEIISDRAAIANGFNNYFVSFGPKLASKFSSNANPISYVKSIKCLTIDPSLF